MADISNLSGLQSAEPLDLEIYKDAKEFRLPPAGTYTLRAPEQFPATAFGATKAGFLSVQIDPTIVGPTGEGLTVRFQKVSAKPYQRGGTTVSQLGDYLRATGSKAKVSGDPQSQANAAEQTAGAVYQAKLDWSAYNKVTGLRVRGMKNFPSDGNGGFRPWVEDPNDHNEDGTNKRLRANLEIVQFIAAS